MDNSIQAHQKELCNKLWAMANALRGNMEAYEFKNYILGMIFYYYLSDKTEKYMVNLLKDDNISYEDAWNDEEYKAAIVEEALRDLGYIIEPEYLFRKMVKMVENRSFDIEFLQKAINALMESTIGNDSQEDFDGLFSDMQLDSTKLGHTVKDRSAVMAKIIASLDEINFSVDDTKIDVLGNAYEYLIGQFAATAGKKAGEFYTPSGPAELLCRLACLGLTDVKDAADPTCGSGSLLLRLKNYANVRNYYGQELTSTTYNLARMNMILRGIPYRNFNIYNGDTLEHDYFGDISDRPSEMTLMATRRHFDRVASLIPEGRPVIGGYTDASINYISPTVIDDCSWDDPSMQEEIFGPVLPVIVFKDLQSEVIDKVKAGEKPLSLYIFSRNRGDVRKVLSQVSFGGGCVNETIMHLGNENLPFGGVGNSGMGAYHGKTGFDTFSHQKSVLYKSSWFNFDLLKPPYGEKLKLIRKVYK